MIITTFAKPFLRPRKRIITRNGDKGEVREVETQTDMFEYV
jgi:hypothetical protein